MQSPRVWGSLQLFTYQDWKVLHRCKDTWMPWQRVYKPECKEQKNSLWKRKSVWTQRDLHKSWCQVLPSFYTGRTCFFSRHYPSGPNASVLHLEVELETEQVWLWEKQVNAFTVSAEIMSARGSWRSLIHTAARSRTTPGTRWGQLRLYAIVCEHPPGAGVPWALLMAFSNALACLWDFWVAICSGQHTSWTKGGSMRCRQMNEEKQTNLQTSAAESYTDRFGIVWDRKDL